MRRLLRILVEIPVAVAVILIGLWGGLALWYRLPLPELARVIAGAAFLGLALVVAIRLFRRRPFRSLAAFALIFAVLLAWWSTIEPPRDADWAPDVAHQVTGMIKGDTLTLDGVLAFDWKSDTDYIQRWESRSYDLAELRTVDLFLSYWGGPEMAHFILSFGFEGERYLAWSIEVKRTKTGVYSPLADLFKTDPLVIIATEERDVVRVRSNIRGEDVQIYRLRMPPDIARRLLTEYVEDANALAAKPAFYNSITTNCTTTVAKMIKVVNDKMTFDWRLIVNGYLPEYLYDHGSIDTRKSLEELRAAAHIRDRALAAGDSPDFSALIRVGVPSPHDP